MGYVHGYSDYEAGRLRNSAHALSGLIHAQVRYPEGALVLEAPCGVGAQTEFLVGNNPGTRFVCADISEASVRVAMGQNPGLPFLAGDLYALPFPNATFDHVFACYVLEHLERPGRALENLLRVLKPGGTLTSVEGDHGSCFFYPETPEALAAWACLPELQALLGGDSLIGRRMYSVLAGAGFSDVWVEPIRIYCDPSLPRMMKGFVEDTIVGMLRGIESEVIERGMLDPAVFRKGVEDILAITTHPEGAFCYTFFRAVGSAPDR
ncbi:MAG: methyltransferase domain-containing protein [Candidatus Hydrogenedentes bacterium]|jgi:SAM-dependent methyltransferase|nr:methyltransferase domain-containing protein [FCB group bacterium]NLT62763.1 methyltransferase domain-containing protein [Candidatus Hydrogenedentota bacterium]HNV21353.1 methyltransferase domain-containing protein [Candidatus Hydrogenedentota bacterium]HNZ16785.1 methyltransferase domain-containing protein [Candidatus Hydrogenedentota bacterium]HOH32606.1 methyltransferase domain-containing protein [Candidatus Hydrogenedentota bacterium]